MDSDTTDDTTTNEAATDDASADSFDEAPLDDTHYGHVRYAAIETAGVRWFDPRTGQEHLQIPADDELADGERRLLYAKIVPYRPEEFGTPADRYATEFVHEQREGEHTHQYSDRGDIYESLDAARAALREEVPDYDDYPRKDAVKERTGTDYTAVEGVEVVAP